MYASLLHKRGWQVDGQVRRTVDDRSLVVFFCTPPQSGRPVGDGDSGPQAEVIIAGHRMLGMPHELARHALEAAHELTAFELAVELDNMIDAYRSRPTVRP